jgi:NAD+ diphosphatase
MEVGETPEETIRREVREETAIEVTNIRYVSSQSWPFPSQLMLGFFADYAGGEIQVDGNEIAEAGWFLPKDLPKTPGPGISVAGQLIELFLKSRSKRST